jgi:hypothetical protein
MNLRGVGMLVLWTTCVAATTEAQAPPVRSFVFTVTPGSSGLSERWAVHYDAGYADRTAAPFGYDGVEQRVGVQGDLGSGFTVLGQVGLGVSDGRTTSTNQEAELLKSLRAPARAFQVAAGLGLRREWEGTTTLLGRVTLGHAFRRSSLFGNLRLEKPLAHGRDSVDLITSVGWHHRLGSALHVGVETIGEDLEGFWEAEEAEGGAKLFVGPSVLLAPAHRRFSASLCGGPIVYATRSGRASSAARPLGANGNGYTVRLSVAYAF